MVKVYGIPNCDTVKKSLNWLKNNDLEVEFHNYKTEGITEAKLKEWLKTVPLEKLVNKKSTTWKALTAEQQAEAATKSTAVKLMKEKTSLIKRPLIEWENGQLSVGFDEALFSQNK